MHAFSIFVFAPVQCNSACFTWKSALEIRSLLNLGFDTPVATLSALGLVGPVSVYCEWVRWKV